MKRLFSPAGLSAIIGLVLFAAAVPATKEAAAQKSGGILERSDSVNARKTPDSTVRGVDSSVTTIRRSSDYGTVGTQITPPQGSLSGRRDFGPSIYGPRQFGTRYGVQRFHRHSHTGGRSAIGIRK